MLQKLFNHYQITLASSSPRRQQLLREAGIPFVLKTKPVAENYPRELKREEITNYLAVLKSKPFEKSLQDNELLITSDTIVWHRDKALEKPKNAEQATQMLQKLSGTDHEVISSVCIRSQHFQEVFSDVTKVFFKKLTADEILHYVEHFKPYDKAGSYGIQEGLGLVGVEKIEGNYANVMGLPVHKVYKILKKIERSKI